MGHVWADALPVGEYACRTNLLSATFSAAAAGFFFLVVHESLRRGSADLAAGAAGCSRSAAAAAAGSWRRSPSPTGRTRNETEVYARRHVHHRG